MRYLWRCVYYIKHQVDLIGLGPIINITVYFFHVSSQPPNSCKHICLKDLTQQEWRRKYLQWVMLYFWCTNNHKNCLWEQPWGIAMGIVVEHSHGCSCRHSCGCYLGFIFWCCLGCSCWYSHVGHSHVRCSSWRSHVGYSHEYNDWLSH